jgi:transcriptional regulator
MIKSKQFAGSDQDTRRLVAENPFGLVVSALGGRLIGTPVPLLLESDGTDRGHLLGHMARANPQVDALRVDPDALVVFLGPHGYVSPSWLSDRTQAPTWNYETAHFDVRVEFDESAEATHRALRRLVDHMEVGREAAWSIEDMGPRYDRLASAIIAFRAKIVDVHAKFKLGQNERSDVYRDILRGLARTGAHELAQAMRRANSHRLPELETATSGSEVRRTAR